MDLKTIKLDTFRSYDLKGLKAVSIEIRKEISSSKMDIFTEKSKKAANLMKLKKNLARSLTLINEKKNSEVSK